MKFSLDLAKHYELEENLFNRMIELGFEEDIEEEVYSIINDMDKQVYIDIDTIQELKAILYPYTGSIVIDFEYNEILIYNSWIE